VNARRFWIGEKDRPVMAPEGFVYLVLARVGPSSGTRWDRRAGASQVESEYSSSGESEGL